MEHSTYSFSDIYINIAHPSVGQFSANGKGLGSINVAKAQERAVQDLASDGSVMTSKIAGDNGTISLTSQQTSALDAFMQDWFNYVHSPSTPAIELTRGSIFIRELTTGKTTTCTGVCPQKEPDDNKEAQGQKKTWVLLAQEIHKQ